MVAALGPSGKVAWLAGLDSGPDERPIQEQLVEHGKMIADYFQELHAGLSVLQAAGIKVGRSARGGKENHQPCRHYGRSRHG